MKKFFVVLILILFLFLAGCNEKAENKSLDSDEKTISEEDLCSNSNYSTKKSNEAAVGGGYEEFIILDFNSQQKLRHEVYEKGDSALGGIGDLTCLTYLVLEPKGKEIEGSYPFNTISDISGLSKLTNLKTLNLTSTNVSDLTPLKNMDKLERLILLNTEVSDVSPLKNLKTLKKLTLNVTKVNDVSPLSGLSNLKYLDLYNTCFTDLTPFENMTGLKTLGLFYNPQISVEECIALKEKLPDTDVECPTGYDPGNNKCLD